MINFMVLILGVIFLGGTGRADEYIIGAGDSVHVFVWGEPELTGPALVRPDGRITLPGVGEIVADGLTPEALQKEITDRLAALVKDPKVTVSMVGIENSKVYIIGGSTATGVYPLKQKASLLHLLVGMDLARVDLHGAHVMRDGVRIDRNFDLLLHNGDQSQDLVLRHNDIIVFSALAEAFVYVVGAVNEPRALPYKEGMTVLDALLGCGGFNKFAKKNGTVVVRQENGAEQRIKVRGQDLVEGRDMSQNVTLRRGDYVIAVESFF